MIDHKSWHVLALPRVFLQGKAPPAVKRHTSSSDRCASPLNATTYLNIWHCRVNLQMFADDIEVVASVLHTYVQYGPPHTHVTCLPWSLQVHICNSTCIYIISSQIYAYNSTLLLWLSIPHFLFTAGAWWEHWIDKVNCTHVPHLTSTNQLAASAITPVTTCNVNFRLFIPWMWDMDKLGTKVALNARPNSLFKINVHWLRYAHALHCDAQAQWQSQQLNTHALAKANKMAHSCTSNFDENSVVL